MIMATIYDDTLPMVISHLWKLSSENETTTYFKYSFFVINVPNPNILK